LTAGSTDAYTIESMTPTRIVLAALLAAQLLSARPVSARHHGGNKPAPPRPGKFDYYVLSLSWSPEHCAEVPGPPDDSQCGTNRHYAFVVHGLWPQYDKGGYPQTCSTHQRLGSDVITKTLDIMPSETLIRHEWQKHGTCSGLPPDAYFDGARRAFKAVSIPDDYQHPTTAFQVTAASVRGAFRTANPSIPENGIVVSCNGRFFTEVRLCLGKGDLAIRSCGKGARDNCRGQVTVRPIR